jgi:hypothetical protein
MKYPVKSIYDSFLDLFNNLNTGGVKYPVYRNLANAKSMNYVYVSNVRCRLDDTKKYVWFTTLDIEIYSDKFAQSGSPSAIDDIAGQVITILTSKNYGLNGFSVIIYPLITNVEAHEEKIPKEYGNNIVEKIIINVEFQIQEQ